MQGTVLRFTERPFPFLCDCIVRASRSKRFVKPWSQALRRLSTSVLPFPSFLLSLSLSLVITVKVQLRCLRWELSQRCVTTMWRFTRLVTKPPAVFHTCGINKSFFHTHKHPHNHMHLSSTTCGHIISPSGSFLFDQTPQKFKFSFFLAFQEQFWQAKGKRNTVLQLHWITSVCSYLVRTLQFANDSLASLLIASCSLSFVISCRLWHFHKLALCAISSNCSNMKKEREWMWPERTVQAANNETRH